MVHMKAFVPRGLPRNRQTIAYQQVPAINGGTPAVGDGLRRTPEWIGGRLPDGTEIRRTPEWVGGRLPDGTDLRQCPSTEGHLLRYPASEGN